MSPSLSTTTAPSLHHQSQLIDIYNPASTPITPFNKNKETASIQREIKNSHQHWVEAKAPHQHNG